MWVGRMVAEQCTHAAPSSFVTFTYDDDHLPLVYDEETDTWHPTLHKRHVQLLLKQLRHATPLQVRYFGAGEYGEKTGRPHYHLIFFGLDPATHEATFRRLWEHGANTSVYEANPKTFAYVAKYLLKGSRDGEPERDSSLPPRAQRLTEKPSRIMSLRPPIGAEFARSIGRSLSRRVGDHVLVSGRVKPLIRTAVGKYPLARTMKKYAAEVLDLPEEMAKAVFRGQKVEQTWRQTENAFKAHERALATRNRRAKL